MADTFAALADVNFDGARLDAIHSVLAETNSYTRRIHWWIRLFGVVWLTTLIVGLAMGAFMVGVATRTTTQTPYERCINRGTSPSTCRGLYPD